MTNVTDLNSTNDYDNSTDDCTDNKNNFDIVVPTLLLTIPCGLSFLCLMSLMVYSVIKPLFINKGWRNYYTQIIQFAVP